ncbi:MAG: EutN/CcmL family microcompartment protein, partial [Candidatus Oleimicrobiaceae bacterium]
RVQFGRVIGTLVATQNGPGLEGIKFLAVQLLDRNLRPQGDPVIAADGTAQAGPGELVCVLGGREAALALPKKFVPVDHTVAAIIDIVDVLDEQALPPANVRWRGNIFTTREAD